MGRVLSNDAAVFRARLSPRLKRLITNPKRHGAVTLWNALEAEERTAAARAYLGARKDGRERLNEIVASARNFRPQTVEKWPEDKIVETVRNVPLRDPDFASELLSRHHVPGQLSMVTAFLDALGVDHDQGRVGSLATINGNEPAVRSAIGAISEKYEPRSCAIYLLALHSFGAPAGATGRVWLKELLEAPVDEVDTEPEVPTATEAEAVENETKQDHPEQHDPSRQPSFTTLDRLLIYAAVDSAQGIEGALSEDDLDDVVGELVALNGRRHHSYFHAGFRDVLFDKPVGDELPAANESRLRWYWTGAVHGWARRERWDDIVREHARNPVVRGLGSGMSRASVAAVPHIVEALHQEGRAAELAQFVKVRALISRPRIFKPLLDAATELLAKGDAASARPIFELLMKTRRKFEELGVSPTTRLLLDAHRRMAHCLRHLHQHDRAGKLLKDLLNQDPDPNIHAMVHADLGLIEGGFDGLDEVVLPLRLDELDGVVDRLAKGVEYFRESIETETAYSAHGHYCLGVLALGRAVADQAFKDAEHHLQATRTYFSEAADSYSSKLIERANLYFGVAKAQQLSPNKLAHAADITTQSLAAGARMPSYLIEPMILALDLVEEKTDLRRVTKAIIKTGREEALDELAKCEAALDHCPELCHALKSRAQRKGRVGKARAADLRSALRGFLKQDDLEAAGEVLDGLDELAQDDVGVPEFLELLKDRSYYEPAWDRDDAAIARARCHEVRGEYQEAIHVLRELFYRLATPEREAGPGDAAGVLDRIRGYGIDASFYSDVTNRHNALAASEHEAAPLPESGSKRRVRVLVVGGAEQQAQAEDLVREKLKDRYPHIRVTFIQTGWSVNWKRKFAEIEGQMASHDALVIMRFMRTHLGRKIRKQWTGRPWRSCWGGQPGAIVEAVIRAAKAVS